MLEFDVSLTVSVGRFSRLLNADLMIHKYKMIDILILRILIGSERNSGTLLNHGGKRVCSGDLYFLSS